MGKVFSKMMTASIAALLYFARSDAQRERSASSWKVALRKMCAVMISSANFAKQQVSPKIKHHLSQPILVFL